MQKKFTLPLKMQPSNYNHPSLIFNIPSDAVANFLLFNFPFSIKSATFAPGFGSYTPELNHTRREVAANASRHFVPSKHEIKDVCPTKTRNHKSRIQASPSLPNSCFHAHFPACSACRCATTTPISHQHLLLKNLKTPYLVISLYIFNY